jgi:hypothetical protein
MSHYATVTVPVPAVNEVILKEPEVEVEEVKPPGIVKVFAAG